MSLCPHTAPPVVGLPFETPELGGVRRVAVVMPASLLRTMSAERLPPATSTMPTAGL